MENEFHDIDDIPLRVEIQPYMFEPPARAEPKENSEENSETSTSVGDDESRLLNTLWAEGVNVETMTTVPECICCAEIPLIDEIRANSQIECITQHQAFIDNCLNIRVLEVSMYMYIQSQGPLDDNEPINKVYRHIAYRRFVLWIWHHLGSGNRKIIPACVVTKIRSVFPSEQYTGFRYPRPT
ncbi:uncharacterized protein LOC128182739 [Crassostrea angulata]|uniref:uncharacterized protein LOC128182739 n=1 Tax=Magallana angulata TaxID=2784310 RepID=UPI0022B116F3|nr:uncharacterized protein LOC128182739 [Crassostrea angulata]